MPAVETMKPTTDDFAAMLEESFAGTAMMEGRVVPATVTAVGSDFITVDDHRLLARADVARVRAVHRVVLEEMREGLGIGEIVDGDEVEIDALFLGRAHDLSPNAPEPVDADTYCHDSFKLPWT